jgi:hypothetical protein
MKPAKSYSRKLYLSLVMLVIPWILTACTNAYPSATFNTAAAVVEEDSPRKDSLVFAMTYPATFEVVWQAVLAALSQHGEQVSSMDKEAGLILTKSIMVDPARLKAITRPEDEPFTRAGGRYTLVITVIKQDAALTKVHIRAVIIGFISKLISNPLGGKPLRSNGTLEAEIFQAIAAQIRRW